MLLSLRKSAQKNSLEYHRHTEAAGYRSTTIYLCFENDCNAQCHFINGNRMHCIVALISHSGFVKKSFFSPCVKNCRLSAVGRNGDMSSVKNVRERPGNKNATFEMKPIVHCLQIELLRIYYNGYA